MEKNVRFMEGKTERSFLYVSDEAFELILFFGKLGEIYNKTDKEYV